MTYIPTREPRHVSYTPLDDITDATANPKGHHLDGIAASITRFGFVTPAVVDERTGRMVAGHGRVQALRTMRDAGQTPPAGVRLAADGTWLVPILAGWSSRSDAEADAYLVADNEWTLRGGWDDAELGRFLSGIVDDDPDLLAVTGFTDDDLTALLIGDEVPGGDGESPADEDAEDPVTQPGDVWQLGPHQLTCGDTNPGYCDVICRRFQQHTGIIPILEATHTPHDFITD